MFHFMHIFLYTQTHARTHSHTYTHTHAHTHAHTHRLQKFVDTIAAYVIEKAPDLMVKEFEREGVKLHATVMNSRFPASAAKDCTGKSGPETDWRKRQPEPEWKQRPVRSAFDATNIFKVKFTITLRLVLFVLL